MTPSEEAHTTQNVGADAAAPASELRALIAVGRQAAEQLHASGDPEAEAIIVALFARATLTAEAVALLCEHGYGQQAMAANRILFELLVDLRWTIANQELAKERFVQHARFDQHLRRQVARRYPALFPPAGEAAGLEADEIAELQRLFGAYGHKSWTGLSMHERVRAIADQFPEGVARQNLWTYHDVLHRLNNSEVHPSSWSLGRILRRVPREDGTEMLQFRIEVESELAAYAAGQAWWLYGELTSAVVDHFRLPRERLEQLARRAPFGGAG